MADHRRSSLALVAALALSFACSLFTPALPLPATNPPQTEAPRPPTATPSPPTAEVPQRAPIHIASQTPPPSATVFPEEQLTTVANSAGSILATVPTVWTDIRSLDWIDDQNRVMGHVLLASTDVDAFLEWKVEGVSISVSRKLGIGYIQLLERDYAKYSKLCNDPFHTFWDEASSLQRGKSFVLDDCGGVQDGWLSVMSVVPKDGSGAYVAEVLAYDMPPTYGDTFREIMLRFEVSPDKLP
jgi:hypothetical protein